MTRIKSIPQPLCSVGNPSLCVYCASGTSSEKQTVEKCLVARRSVIPIELSVWRRRSTKQIKKVSQVPAKAADAAAAHLLWPNESRLVAHCGESLVHILVCRAYQSNLAIWRDKCIYTKKCCSGWIFFLCSFTMYGDTIVWRRRRPWMAKVPIWRPRRVVFLLIRFLGQAANFWSTTRPAATRRARCCYAARRRPLVIFC